MFDFKTIAAGTTIAGTLGLAALGIGTGIANATPPALSGTPWAQGPGYGHGPGNGHDWNGGGYNGGGYNGGGYWGPPPPPPPPNYGYGYGGYDNGGPSACVQGPLGFVHICL